jgi:LysR family transcriptional regulator, glycine cleavage system transcriptional activator
MRALPPFDGLIAFDAALRHRSMTRAAAELGLTQSAISHRLKKLEGFVGTRLLERTAGGLLPTAAGVTLAEGLGRMLDEMAELRARSRASLRTKTLKIGLGSALANYWLVRRLTAFASAHPDIAIELCIVEGDVQARALDLDVQIRWIAKAGARNNSTQRLLFDEMVFPVAVPSLLPRGRPLREPDVLGTLPVLHKGIAGRNDGAEWSWPVWFERLGITAPVRAGLRFDNLGTAITAALQGSGVVLARSLLVHDVLAEKRLSRVVSPDWDMACSKAHVIRWPAALTGDRRVAVFADWVVREAERTSLQ